MPTLVATGQITIQDVMDGLYARLSNEAVTVPADTDGSNPDLTGCATTISIFLGPLDVSAEWTVTALPSAGITGTLVGKTFTPTGFTTDAGYVDLVASKPGQVDIVARFTLAKARRGYAGPSIDVIASRVGVGFVDNVMSPPVQPICFTLVRNEAIGPALWYATDSAGVTTDDGMLTAMGASFGMFTGIGDNCFLTVSSFGDDNHVALTCIVGELIHVKVVPRLDRSTAEPNADVTALAQISIALTTDQTIPATYNGTVTSEDLANVIWAPAVTKGGSSIKLADGTSYSLANQVGGTFAIDNTNGSPTKGNVTISAMSSNIAQAELTITVNSIVQPKLLLKVTKDLGAPPPSGGSTPKTVTWGAGEFVTLNTVSYTPVVTAMKTVALASGESLYGTAPLTYNVAGTNTPPLNRTMTFKWQYSVAGANSWNDFASPITGSTASCADFANEINAVPGTVAVTQTKSGLGAGNYDVRLVAICSATGRNMSTSGTATVEAKV